MNENKFYASYPDQSSMCTARYVVCFHDGERHVTVNTGILVH